LSYLAIARRAVRPRRIVGQLTVGVALARTLWPAASVSGLYFQNPEARYFAVDLVTRDQVENYAARKGMPIREVERWLAPNLSYEAD
jgi:5-methyltetrahydrofolate--homocysteine methyltransferase